MVGCRRLKLSEVTHDRSGLTDAESAATDAADILHVVIVITKRAAMGAGG
jgi:hypothetical protein